MPRTPGCTAMPSAPRRPAACPAAFLEDVPDALRRLLRRYARHPWAVHHGGGSGALRDRRLARRCANSSATAPWSGASCGPGGQRARVV